MQEIFYFCPVCLGRLRLPGTVGHYARHVAQGHLEAGTPKVGAIPQSYRLSEAMLTVLFPEAQHGPASLYRGWWRYGFECLSVQPPTLRELRRRRNHWLVDQRLAWEVTR